MRSGGWLPVSAGCAFALAALTFAVETSWSPLATLDKFVNTSLYAFGLAHDGWIAAWRVITHAGSTVFALAIWLVTVVVLARSGRRREVIAVTVAVLVSQLVFRALRLLVYRPRPPESFVHVVAPSFPSGHTMAATTGALLVGMLLWPVTRGAWSRAALAAGMIAWAGLVGVSRVALCVHWPSDVVAGWLCAVAFVPPAYLLARRYIVEPAPSPPDRAPR